MSTATFPAGRYGRRRSPRHGPRWLLLVLGGLVLLVGVVVAGTLYIKHSDAGVDSQVVTVDFTHRDHVTVTFRVTKPAGVPATCIVRARDRSGAEISHATVPVPAGRDGDKTVVVTYTLATSRQPNTGEVYGCALTEPS